MNATGSNRSRRGAAITLVFLALIPLLLALAALLTAAVGHHGEAVHDLGRSTAESISFSGAQDALAKLEQARTLDGEYDLAINGGVARILATPWIGDGADNDDNGLIDDAEEEDFFSIRSDGWLNALPDGEANASVQSFHAATDVVAEVVDFDFAFDQAIYLDDPGATIDINGGAFELSGHDENLDGSGGPDGSKPAVGINGDPSHVISQIANNQKAQIVGSLPDPAIGQTGALSFDDHLALLAPLASMEWDGAASSYSGEIGDYANRKGEIAHASGDLKIHGTTTGAGILIVEGDLELDGHFTFAGLVLVRGNVSFQGGGGVKELHGAMLVWGEDGTGTPTEDLEINGTVQVAYSTEGLEIASTSAGVKVHYWREQ